MDLQTSNSPLSSPTPEMLSAFLKEIEQEQTRRRTENALAYYRPYAKQQISRRRCVGTASPA